MQVFAQARQLSLCNAGMLRAINRLWGKDGSEGLPKDDVLATLGRDLKKQLTQRQCFAEMPPIFQQLISGFAELPVKKEAAGVENGGKNEKAAGKAGGKAKARAKAVEKAGKAGGKGKTRKKADDAEPSEKPPKKRK